MASLTANMYSHQEEGLRVVDTGKSKLKVVLDRNGTNLWTIETDAGPLPVAFRNQTYTTHRHAAIAIKNYLDGHAERQIVYKVNRKKTDSEE